MKKRILSVALVAVMALSLAFTGCGNKSEEGGSGDSGSKTESNGKKVGVAMPTQSSERWIRDGKNMKEKLDESETVVEQLEKAYKASGVKIIRKPIRGGTDGSRLTEMGIPTPNIFTGAHQYHSRNEWVSLNQMSKAADIVLNLLTQN